MSRKEDEEEEQEEVEKVEGEEEELEEGKHYFRPWTRIKGYLILEGVKMDKLKQFRANFLSSEM